MDQLIEFFSKLFSTADWPPRWRCGYWSDFHGWLYISSDIAIWLAYFIIPVIIIWFIQKRPDIPFLPVFWLFGAFIILCGTTHIIDALIFWWPAYRVSAVARFVTGVVSFITVFALIRDIPKALDLKTNGSKKNLKELEQEISRSKNEIAALKNELNRIKQGR